MIVTYDAGHYGKYNAGVNGYWESENNWSIALKFKAIGSSYGITTKLTKTSLANNPGLTIRGQMAKGSSIFISQHSNANDGGDRGCMVFRSVDLSSDKAHAALISALISAATGLKNLGGRTNESKKYPGEDYYTVIDAAQDIGCPHVFLVESGFHDNAADCSLIRTTHGQLSIAAAEVVACIKIMGGSMPTANVLKVQKFLGVTQDGDLGAKTITAICEYELKNNRAITGAISAWILGKISASEAKEESKVAETNTTPQWMIEGEKYLRDNGYTDTNPDDPNTPVTLGMLGVILANYDKKHKE